MGQVGLAWPQIGVDTYLHPFHSYGDDRLLSTILRNLVISSQMMQTRGFFFFFFYLLLLPETFRSDIFI